MGLFQLRESGYRAHCGKEVIAAQGPLETGSSQWQEYETAEFIVKTPGVLVLSSQSCFYIVQGPNPAKGLPTVKQSPHLNYLN